LKTSLKDIWLLQVEFPNYSRLPSFGEQQRTLNKLKICKTPVTGIRFKLIIKKPEVKISRHQPFKITIIVPCFSATKIARRLATFVKILNQEDISLHQNHDTMQEVGIT
jgi:hypothetical protein